jgi:hypothetical protein
MGLLRILDSTGDTTIEWSALDDTVKEAEATLTKLLASRHLAFARPAGAPADEAVQVKAFVPEAEEIIVVRPLQGG